MPSGEAALPCLSFAFLLRGAGGGAMVLGKVTVPGRPTNLDYRNYLKYWDR